MHRLLLLLLAICPLLAAAQARIGVLNFTENSEAYQEGFRKALQRQGYVEGRDILIEWRSAGGHMDRARKHADELVQLKVDIIVARLTPAVQAAKEATATIPIVMAGAGDPLGTKLVTNLARPGGNVTGVAGLAAEMSGKRIELLQELVPGLKRVGLLTNRSDPFAEPFIAESQAAARKLGIELALADVRTPEEISTAYAGLKKAGVQAVIVQGILTDAAWRAAELALQHRLPAISFVPPFAERGGLMNVSSSLSEAQERAASYVARILSGAKAGELPVEQPARFELTINLRTARALGLTVLPSLLLRADQVID